MIKELMMTQTSVILLLSLILASNLRICSRKTPFSIKCSENKYFAMYLMLLIRPSSLIVGILPAFYKISSDLVIV